MRTDRRLVGVTVAGAAGGLVNALLCYLGWPEPVQDAGFKWHILPAGLLHGGVLALVAVAAARLGAGRSAAVRWNLALPVAWVAGYLSWIPIEISVSGRLGPRTAIWPFDGSNPAAGLWIPLAYFGGAGLLLYLWVAQARVRGGLVLVMAAASMAGAIGSLWFWILFEYWYFSLIHGVVWGCAVGVALWYYGDQGSSRHRTSGCS